MAEINNLRTELAKHAEWQVDDIVEYRGTRFKLSLLKLHDDGSVASLLYGYKELNNGGWHKNDQFISGRENVKLIERPEAK